MAKILIIEDEKEIADLEKDYLEMNGFEVETFDRGDDGLEAAMKNDYDLVVLDLMLPGTDGFDICRKVRAEKNIPIMGICLGMQVLFEKGYEVEECNGLGFLEGSVQKLQVNAKIPHMGWNELIFNQNHPLLSHIKEKDYVYFVHSYYLKADSEEIVSAQTSYGTVIDASVQYGNIYATQFHPEKSGTVGLKILRNFVAICGGDK